jgi:radical SAM protein with 4Fe4S-binding SPASM domain
MSVFEGFPYVIGWELTLGCNLGCLHCASSAGRARAGELGLAEAVGICDQLPEMLVDEVIFTGGEPLLNEHWREIAVRLAGLGIKTGMVTNGLLLSDTVVGEMLDSGMNAIGVSLDGPESLHDRLRASPGAFRKSMENIANARKRGMRVTIITSVTGINIGRLEDIKDIVVSCGAWKWQLQPFFPVGRGKANPELDITKGQFLELGRYIKRTRPIAKGLGLEIVPADSCGYFSSLDFPEFGWKGCGAGRFSCGIMSDGRVKGCLSWPDSKSDGDLRTRRFWDIWFGEGAFAEQRRYSAADVVGDCAGCEVALECGGGCQSMSLATTGKFHADPFCYRSIMETA